MPRNKPNDIVLPLPTADEIKIGAKILEKNPALAARLDKQLGGGIGDPAMMVGFVLHGMINGIMAGKEEGREEGEEGEEAEGREEGEERGG